MLTKRGAENLTGRSIRSLLIATLLALFGTVLPGCVSSATSDFEAMSVSPARGPVVAQANTQSASRAMAIDSPSTTQITPVTPALQAVVTQPTNIAPVTASIFAAQNPGPNSATIAGAPSLVPVPTINPLKESLYATPPQQVALIKPQAATAETWDPGTGEIPGAAEARLPLTSVHEATDGPARQSTNTLDNGEPVPSMAELKSKPTKKNFTLSDLFKRKRPTSNFDSDRFAKQRGKPVVLAGVAPLNSQALPGVKVSAMFPTAEPSDDEHHEDAPAGLMKLASLPGMMRMAPNGLWMQTDNVEIRCLRPQLVTMLKAVEAHYQRPVIVTSGFRDNGHNRRAGGARGSLHTLCAAADIQIEGVSKWQLAEYMRSVPGRGGVGTYCHTDSVHIDVGTARDWNWRCRRKKRRA